MEQDWEVLERVFSEALELPPEARPRFVKEQSGDNLWLRHELESLLAVPETKSDAAFNSGTGIVRELLAALDSEYAVGREIGGYRIESLISSGGMGIVYKALEIGTGEPVALKLLPPEESQNPRRIRRLAREARVLAKLRHPGIVRIKEYRPQPGGHFLVMELVAGETLQTLLAAGPIPIRQALDWAAQMAAALEAAHAQHVVHRDLKPGNVMVERATGRVKLLDFGLARMADAEPSTHTQTTVEGTVAGTFSYFSPEQANGGRGDERSDIFSFGAVFYEMISGHRAFDRPGAAATAAAVLTEQPDPLPPPVPMQLQNLIGRCLEKDPARRYATMREVGEAIEDLRNLERQGRLKPPMRKKTRLAVAAACVLAGAVATAWLAGVRPPMAQPRSSVAVLPFTSSGLDPASRYLSQGLTDELTEALARHKTLRVIDPASAAQFGRSNAPPGEAARLLHVANVVEGSVERTSGGIHIDARLRRLSDGAVLWSNRYDRPEADLPAVQSELAAGIATSLKAGAAAPSARHVPPQEAHDALLKARYEGQQMTTAALQQAEADLQHAIDLDPKYADAYLGMAIANYDQAVARGSTYATEEERNSTEKFLHRALALDPGMPSAHAMLALLAMQYDWDWERAERELRLALAAGSNSTAENYYAWLLIFRGRFADADPHIQRMVDLDPFSTVTMTNLAVARLQEGRFAQAREVAQQIGTQFPKILAAQQIIGGTYIFEGRPKLALPIFRELKQRFPPGQMYEAMAYAAEGQREEALRLIRPFEEKYPNPGVALQWFALVYGVMGDEANTVKWLQRSAGRHEWQALNLAVNPAFAQVRNSSGFRALEKRMGLGQ